MQYLLLIYTDEADWEDTTDKQRQAMYEEYAALSTDLRDKGQYGGGNELAATSTATTVRVRDG